MKESIWRNGLAGSLSSGTINTTTGSLPLCIWPPENQTVHCALLLCFPLQLPHLPIPLFLRWLLLTLVCPNQPFMLKQFRKLKKKRKTHVFRVSPWEDLTHTAAVCNWVWQKIDFTQMLEGQAMWDELPLEIYENHPPLRPNSWPTFERM